MSWLLLFAIVGFACERNAGTSTENGDVVVSRSDGLPVLVTLPSFSLTDQTGQTFASDQLAGKIWIGNFIFTRCPATCPIQTANLSALQPRLQQLDGGKGNIHLLSITVDPEYDTPNILSEYAARADADTEHWHFLTGAREEIWPLCKQGFKLAVGDNPPEANSLIMHSSKLILVDGQGRIRGFFEGTTEEGVSAAFDGVQTLLQEHATEPTS